MTIAYHFQDDALPPNRYPANAYQYLAPGALDPLPPVHDGPVYHYAYPKTALAIFASDSLRASRYDCMNDPSENQYGWEVIQKRYLQRKSDFSDAVRFQFDETFAYNMKAGWLSSLFVLSASKRNGLDQFRGYGPVGIEIPRGVWIHGDANDPHNLHPYRASWRKVLYGPEDAMPYVDLMLDCCAQIIDRPAPWDFTDEGYLSLVTMRVLAMHIKHPEYRSEAEVRLVFDFIHNARHQTQTHQVGSETVTYIAVEPEVENVGDRKPSPLVKSIELGPMLSDPVSLQNLRAHAAQIFTKSPPIRQSAHPYRERNQAPFPAPKGTSPTHPSTP